MESLTIVQRQSPWRNIGKQLKQSRFLIAMIIPAVAFYFIFCYIPMYGVLMINYDWFVENFDSKGDSDKTNDTWDYNFANKWGDNLNLLLKYCQANNIQVAFGSWNVVGTLSDDVWNMEPTLPYETEGYYNGCVFPTGNVIKDGTLYVYYGAADHFIGLATCSIDELVESLWKEDRV